MKEEERYTLTTSIVHEFFFYREKKDFDAFWLATGTELTWLGRLFFGDRLVFLYRKKTYVEYSIE